MDISSVNTTASRPNLEQCINQVVNQIFYGTLMAEFRRSNPSTLMGSSFADQCFQREFDMHLIENLSRQTNSPLVKSMLQRLSPEVASGVIRSEGTARMAEEESNG